MKKIILKNNLKAIAIHFFLCAVMTLSIVLLVFLFLRELTHFFSENEFAEKLYSIFFYILFLSGYFFGGKFFLRDTKNFFGNIASVVGLFLVMLLGMFNWFLIIPFRIVLLFIEYGTFGDIFMITMPFFPPLLMFLGMKTQKRNEDCV
ncbi:MAG: hypothetical protein FWD19_01415 [Defluviitaleaceae bacterium]|nr:hypothetical protein [Defluviitaleaceae bacterium]